MIKNKALSQFKNQIVRDLVRAEKKLEARQFCFTPNGEKWVEYIGRRKENADILEHVQYLYAVEVGDTKTVKRIVRTRLS